MKTDLSFLQLPIQNVGLPQHISEAAKSHGYNNLQELLAADLAQLLQSDWFDIEAFEELAKLLNANKMWQQK